MSSSIGEALFELKDKGPAHAIAALNVGGTNIAHFFDTLPAELKQAITPLLQQQRFERPDAQDVADVRAAIGRGDLQAARDLITLATAHNWYEEHKLVEVEQRRQRRARSTAAQTQTRFDLRNSPGLQAGQRVRVPMIDATLADGEAYHK